MSCVEKHVYVNLVSLLYPGLGHNPVFAEQTAELPSVVKNRQPFSVSGIRWELFQKLLASFIQEPV